MKKKLVIFLVAAVVVAVAAIILMNVKKSTGSDSESTVEDSVNVPSFNADSAYASIVKQCAFGARVPNTEAHDKCAEYIVGEFKRLGYVVRVQKCELKAFDGTMLKCENIFATLDTAAQRRVLVTAHWDSRPWADQDADESRRKEPVLAANDGASGVAVILEMARIVAAQRPSVTVDFACLDCEDYGAPDWAKKGDESDEKSWCLGTQYFAANLPLRDYSPLYAVNLDMVGGKGAIFYQEGFSLQMASAIVDKVWNAAAAAGYSSTFVSSQGGYVTDDHLPLNKIAGIPTIDIIPYYRDLDNSFGPTWHTTNDTPANIDKNTLKAVGQTMLQVVYNEK